MEKEPTPTIRNAAIKAAAYFISTIEITKKYINSLDLNIHEGRVRNSIQPVEFMNIPNKIPTELTSPK